MSCTAAFATVKNTLRVRCVANLTLPVLPCVLFTQSSTFDGRALTLAAQPFDCATDLSSFVVFFHSESVALYTNSAALHSRPVAAFDALPLMLLCHIVHHTRSFD